MAVLPVDRGYAWVICLGCSICNFFVSGPVRSYGLMFVQVNERFESPKAVSALALSIVSLAVAIISPVAAWLGERYSQRVVVIAGAVCTFLAMFLTAFATNVYWVCATFGLLSGIGLGAIFSPSMVMLGYYFDKRRAFANGLATAGGSIGQLCIPFLFTYIMETYGFRGGLIIFSAFLLHCMIGGALLRPVSAYDKRPDDDDNDDVDIERKDVETRAFSKEGNGGFVNGNLSVVVDKDKSQSQSLMDVRKISLTAGDRADYSSLQDLDKVKTKRRYLVEPSDKHHLHKASSLALAPYQKPTSDMLEESGAVPEQQQAKGFRAIMAELYDFNLLCESRGYLFYAIGMCTGHMGYVCTCLFLPPFAREKGLSPYEVALLMALTGGSDLVGRILGGFIADLKLLRQTTFSGLCLMFTGACAGLMTLYPVFGTLVFFAVVLGGVGGTYVAMMLPMVIELVGLGKVSAGFSLGIMASGLMAVPTPIVLGLLRDYTLSYNWSLACCGMLLVLGGCLFVVAGFQKQFTDKKLVVNMEDDKDSI